MKNNTKKVTLNSAQESKLEFTPEFIKDVKASIAWDSLNLVEQAKGLLMSKVTAQLMSEDLVTPAAQKAFANLYPSLVDTLTQEIVDEVTCAVTISQEEASDELYVDGVVLPQTEELAV